jgi:hypothetical protein
LARSLSKSQGSPKGGECPNKKTILYSPSHPTNPSPSSPPLKIHKLTHVEMVEHQLKGLYYNCDEKYFPRHKCKEKKLFMAISEDILEDELKLYLKNLFLHQLKTFLPLIN